MIKTVKKYLVPHEGNSYTPHLLRERSLAAIFCLAFVLFCTSLGSSYILKKTDFGAAVLPAVLVDLTNEHRIENNQKPLSVNHTLEIAALMKAKDMASKGYFAHISPEGVTPWQWFINAGYPFVYAGENLAINFTESSDVENAWIASPTHHANLINSKFDETGIATYDGTYMGRSTTFVVQLFGKRPQTRATTPEVIKPTPVITQKTAQKVAVATQEVKGESIAVAQAPINPKEPAPVLLVNEKTFAVAQNLNENEPSTELTTSPFERESTKFERFLVHQARYVQYIYLALILLVYIVFIGMIVAQLRYKHSSRHIALSVILLCALGALAYWNSHFILSFF
ncbi:MAG: CAP domain-containing protein [Patescibacteria group bacterium]